MLPRPQLKLSGSGVARASIQSGRWSKLGPLVLAAPSVEQAGYAKTCGSKPLSGVLVHTSAFSILHRAAIQNNLPSEQVGSRLDL